MVPVLVYCFLLIGFGDMWFFSWKKCCVDIIGFPSIQFFFLTW